MQTRARQIAREAILRFTAAPPAPEQPRRQPDQQRHAAEQPFKRTAFHLRRNVDSGARKNARQKVKRRPEQAANDIRREEFTHRQIEHSRHHRHQRARRPDKAPDENGKHAVLMQRVFGFIEQRLMFFQEGPAVQRLFKAPAEPERDPVAKEAANNPRRPGLIEIDLAAADERAQRRHQHGAGQQ